METLARFIVSAVDVAEAEGRMLRRELVRLTVTLGLSVVSLLLVMTGLGFCIFGVYRGFSAAVGPAWAGIILGVVWLGLAFVIARSVKARL